MVLSRSEQMARIRGRDTSPELALRRSLHASGLRYRVGMKLPAGRPDLVFQAQQLAVFVDGCQWHGCPEHYVQPRTRTAFWGKKLAENVKRDILQTQKLRALGWHVLRFWEHEVSEDLNRVAAQIRSALSGEVQLSEDDWRVTFVEVINASTDLERRHEVRLSDESVERIVERRRSTRKWRRHKPGAADH